MDDEYQEPGYAEGDRVYTPELVGGTIKSAPQWDEDMGEHTYTVEWDDGRTDDQPESFFDITGGEL